jgi:hypothetical protein
MKLTVATQPITYMNNSMKIFYLKVYSILGYWWHIYCISFEYMIHNSKAIDLNTQNVWYDKGSNVCGRWLSIS